MAAAGCTSIIWSCLSSNSAGCDNNNAAALGWQQPHSSMAKAVAGLDGIQPQRSWRTPGRASWIGQDISRPSGASSDIARTSATATATSTQIAIARHRDVWRAPARATPAEQQRSSSSGNADVGGTRGRGTGNGWTPSLSGTWNANRIMTGSSSIRQQEPSGARGSERTAA